MCSQARISSILVRTNSARLRLSCGGIGGYLVNKFVKQTKIDSWLAHECGFDQVGLVEAESDEGAGRARILWEADPTMGQKEPRLDPRDRVRNQRGPLLSLFFGDRGTQVLDFDQALAHENNLSNFVDAGHPRLADELRIQC